jgi:hypothetical protein
MTGAANRLAKWTDANTIGNSLITDNGATVSFTGALDVTGTGKFSGNVNMNSTGKIINLVTPSADYDAATKKYVDDNASIDFGFYWKREGNNLSGSEVLGSKNSYDLVIITNDLERMRITSGGTLSVSAFSTAGIVKNDASGNLSGGNTVALGAGGNVTGTLPVGNGGTGGTTQAAARTGIGAAASGANSDITSLSALSTALSVGQGGTGQTTLTSGNVLVGNGGGAVTLVSGLTTAAFQVVGSTNTSTCYNLTFTNGILTAKTTVACN